MTRSVLSGVAATVILTAAAVAGCGRPGEPPSPPSITPAAAGGKTYRWIPSPAVDLMSPEGTIIRAAFESEDAATQSDKKGLDAYQDGYPGFVHAQRMPNAARYGGIAPDSQKIAGTYFLEVIGLEQTGASYTAKLCEYGSRTSSLNLGGTYNNETAAPGTGWTVTFGPDPALTPAQQHDPLTQQKGLARRPTDNVFGTWIVTDVSPVGWTFPECNKLAPGTKTVPGDSLPEPPPTLPPDPGWPDGGEA